MALGSVTLVHVPNLSCEEWCAIACDGLERVLDSDGDWSKTVECTHRLLLGAVPKGFNPTSKLRARLKLWTTNCLEELLRRCEHQEQGKVSLVRETSLATVRAFARSVPSAWRWRAHGAKPLVGSRAERCL